MFNSDLLNWQNFLFTGFVVLAWLIILKPFIKNHIEAGE